MVQEIEEVNNENIIIRNMNIIKGAIKEVIRSFTNVSIAVIIAVSITVSIMVSYIHNREAVEVPETPTVQLYDVNGRFNKGRERWDSHLQRWESEYNVPANILWGVILQESGGKQYAEGTTEKVIDGSRRYSRGLFQVVDHWDRFSVYDDPFDPDTNAHVGIEFLKTCNRIVTGSNITNWTDATILRYTFACYNVGPNGKWDSKHAQGYANNVLSIATGTSAPKRYNRAMSIPLVGSINDEGDKNDCNTTVAYCTGIVDWKHGWCSYYIRNRSEAYGKVSPLQINVAECVEGLGYKYKPNWASVN